MTFCTCSSVAECSITMTMGSSLLLVRLLSVLDVRGQPLQAPALVDDSFEHAAHGHGVERTGVLAHDPLQDLRLALRRVDREPERALDAADLHRAGRPAVEQSHELGVYLVDAPAPGLDLGALGAR